MTEAWESAKIKRFEHVTVSPTVVLLRVAGKPARRRLVAERRPVLLADDGDVVKRFVAIPSPPDDRGVLRAAYSVPAELIKPQTVFSLELTDGQVVSLPAPTPGAARVMPPEPELEEDGDWPQDDVATADDHDQDAGELQAGQAVQVGDERPNKRRERRSDPFPKIAELSEALAEAEHSLSRTEAARAKAEAHAAEARAEVESLRARLTELEADAVLNAQRLADVDLRIQAATDQADQRIQAANEEVERRIQASGEEADQRIQTANDAAEQRVHEALVATEAEAQSRLEDAVTEARADADRRLAQAEGEFRAQIAETTRRTEDAVLQAATASGLNDELQQRNAELEDSVHAQQARIAELERAIATTGEPLQREIELLRSARARLERELSDSQDAMRKMTFERDELSRQAAAFDQVAIKARERATQAEGSYGKLQSTLDELETWRGELERRLTSTTTELGAARTRIQEDELELRRIRGELTDTQAALELAQAQVRALQEQLGSGASGVPIEVPAITGSDLERMSAELASLRAAQAEADRNVDAGAAARIRALEAEREELARRAEHLASVLASAERLSDLARELTQARTEAESLQTAASMSGGPDDAPTGIDSLARRAEAEAEQLAARELAEAASQRARFGR